MPILQTIYDDQSAVPEAYRELYTERDGKFELTGVEGVKTQADIDRLTGSLTKERTEHKETKTKLGLWGELDVEQTNKDIAELSEARIRLEQGGGKIDEEKMETLVNARVATQVSPIQRDLDKANTSIVDLTAENDGFRADGVKRTISDAVRKAAGEGKILETAMEDVLLLGERIFEITDDGAVVTRTEVGCTPGIAANIWLTEMQERRPHWWAVSTGGGAKGSGGGGGFEKNPFGAEHWNLTAQGAAIREDRAKATRMAESAGTKIGGTKPKPRNPAEATRT